MGIIRYLAGLADYLNTNEADVAQTHVYHLFDSQIDDAKSYDLQLFNAETGSIPVTVEFDPGDGSGLQAVTSPYGISHSYIPGIYFPSYVFTFGDGSSFTQPLPRLDLEAPSEIFLFDTVGGFSFTTPTYPYTHMSIYGAAGGGGGGGGEWNTFVFAELSGGGGGGGGAVFELERWPYTADMQGLTVSGSIGNRGAAGQGETSSRAARSGGTGGDTIINAWANFPRIVAKGGTGGQRGTLTNPAGGTGGQVSEGFASLVTIQGGNGGSGARAQANTNNTPGDGGSNGGTGGGGGGAHTSGGNLYPPGVASGGTGLNSGQEVTEDNPRVYGNGGNGGNARLFLTAQTGKGYGGGGGGGPGAPSSTGISASGYAGNKGYVLFTFEDLSSSAPATTDQVILFDTPGPFSYTVPIAIYSEIRFYAVAGGGGGGGGGLSDYLHGKSGGGGGGAGAAIELVQTFSLDFQGATISGVVGAGGTGGAGNANGTSGEATIINAVGSNPAITVGGGIGGAAGQITTTADIAGGLGGPGGTGSIALADIIYRTGPDGGNGASAQPNGQLGGVEPQGGGSGNVPGSGGGGGSASGGTGQTAFGVPAGGSGNGITTPTKDTPNAYGAGGKGGNFGGTKNAATDGQGPGAGGGGGVGSDGTVDPTGGDGGNGYVLIVLSTQATPSSAPLTSVPDPTTEPEEAVTYKLTSAAATNQNIIDSGDYVGDSPIQDEINYWDEIAQSSAANADQKALAESIRNIYSNLVAWETGSLPPEAVPPGGSTTAFLGIMAQWMTYVETVPEGTHEELVPWATANGLI